MNPAAQPSRRFAWLAIALPLLLLLLFPLCANLRIATYATGQDPRIFIALAKGLANHTKTLADVASVVVPGWPLALAGVIRLFGMYAAFWVNLPLFAATLLLLAALLADLLGSRPRGLFAAVVCMILLLGGHPSNPHFLLWSFRQTPIYFFSLLSLFAVRRAGLAASAPIARFRAFLWICASLAALALATAVRETSPLVFPSLVLYLCFSPLAPPGASPRPGARRFLLVAFFALCFAAATAIVLAVFATGFSPVNAQSAFFLKWLKAMFSQDFAQLPLWGMLRILREEYGPLGLLFLALGAALSFTRRHRPFLFLFAFPALSYLVFDGLLKIHARFILSTLFFSAPFAALGAFALFRALLRLARRFRHRGIPPPPTFPLAACIAAALLAAYAFAKVLPTVGPWGARISRADVENLLALLAPYASPNRPVVVDPHHRLVQDALNAFSPWPVLEAFPTVPPESFLADPPLPYVQSFSKRAAYSSVFAPHATEVLKEVADLVPVPDGTFSFGGVPYDLILLEPPARTNLLLSLPPPQASLRTPPAPVFWLRLTIPRAAAGHPLSAAVNGIPLASNLPPGRAFVPVPADLVHACGPSNLVLSLSSDAPFPDSVDTEWLFSDGLLAIPFGSQNLPSCDSFLSDDFAPFFNVPNPDPVYPSWTVSTVAREFPGTGTVHLPRIPSPPPGPYPVLVELDVSGLHREMTATLSLDVSFPDFPGVPPLTAAVPHSDRSQHVRLVAPALPAPPSAVRLVATRNLAAPIDSFDNPRRFNSRLYRLSVAPLYPFSSMTVDFSRSGSDAFLDSGFYPLEGGGTPHPGHWTATNAVLLLPPALEARRPLRISLEARTDMFPADRIPAVTFTAGGISVEAVSEAVPGDPSVCRFAAVLPPGTLSATEANRIAFAVAPAFHPADYGSPDTRTLGLFLRYADLAPADAPSSPLRP